MSGFSTAALKVVSSDGRHFVLLEAFTYTTAAGEVITVPAGTTSDGCSTPRLLWRIIPPFGAYWMAAFLHDFLYRDACDPKERCDAIFKEAMLCLGVDELMAETIYEGVSLGGWKSFEDDRAAQKSTP